jgi:hypothetical protein
LSGQEKDKKKGEKDSRIQEGQKLIVGNCIL